LKCSLIICTYNWPEALNLVLKSVSSQSVLPNEIIIADDGSGNATLRVIEFFKKGSLVPVVHSWQKDSGCRIPHSRNRAIAKSKYDYIVVIDGDTVLHKDFIKDHKRYSQKGIYIQGSRVLLQEKFTDKIFKKNIFIRPKFISNHSKNKFNMIRIPLLTSIINFYKSRNIKRIRGCNFSIFKEDILRVNGFNEEITSWGREDSEFVQRLFNAGVKKKYLKFSGIQYHLFHNERVINSQESAKANNQILEDAIHKELVRCKVGIDRHL